MSVLRIFLALVATATIASTLAAQSPESKVTSTAHAVAIQPGTYDLEVVTGGGVVAGTLVLTAIRDSIDAKLHVGEHTPPISSITRKGAQLRLAGSGPGLRIVYDFTFSGSAVRGTFEFNEMSGTVTGTRRK
jgi:hypothetical protein